MTVRELIYELSKLPPDLVVVTNECQATSLHEQLTHEVSVERLLHNGEHLAYVGSDTGPAEESL